MIALSEPFSIQSPVSLVVVGLGTAAIIGAFIKMASVQTVVQGALATMQGDLTSVKVTGEAVHTLSNSAMAAQLLVNVNLLKTLSQQAHRTYSLTKEEADQVAAKGFDDQLTAVEKLYTDHQVNQKAVDDKNREVEVRS
jgi:hypothetical protein